MNLLKSIFVSALLTAALLAAGFAAWQLWQQGGAGWWGLLLAAAPMAGFFIQLMLFPRARTSPHLWPLLVTGLAGTGLALALAQGSGWAALLALLVGVGGWAGYVFWYSSFGARSTAALAVGALLPDFALTALAGSETHSQDLLGSPGLWLFYRGNWCPLCMAQVREIATGYRALAARGVRVHLISPQPQSHTQSLSSRFDAPMSFWQDRDNRAARALGVVAENGLPVGLQLLGYDSDVPMPTVFITNAEGRVIYSDLTSNYRLRPEPAEFLKVLETLPSS